MNIARFGIILLFCASAKAWTGIWNGDSGVRTGSMSVATAFRGHHKAHMLKMEHVFGRHLSGKKIRLLL